MVTIITRAFAFAFKIYLSQAVGAEIVGLYQMALTFFFTLLSISSTGIPLILSRKTAELKGDEHTVNSLTTACLLIAFITTVVIGLLAFFGRSTLSFILSDARSIPLFLVMLPALLSSSIYNVIRGYFWGNRDFLTFSMTELFEEILRIILTVLLITIPFYGISKELGISIAFTISDIICCVVLSILFYIKGGRLTRPIEVKSIIMSSTPITITRLISTVLASFIAIVLPLMMTKVGYTTSEATAYYGRAVGMASPVLMLPLMLTGAISVVLVPELASQNKDNKNAIHSSVDNSLIFSILISCGFSILTFGCGNEIGTILFKDELAGAYIKFASIAILPMALCSMTNSMLNSLGKEGICFKNYLICSVLLVLSVLFLPKYIGVYALAIGQFLLYSVCFMLNINSLYKIGATKFAFIKSLVLCPCIALFASSVTALIISLMNKTTLLLVSVLCGALTGALIFIGLLILLKVIDIEFIHVMLKKLNKSKSKKATVI